MASNGFVHGNPDHPHCLVVVFLRGGADGLNMIVPVEDDGYYRHRPTISIGKKSTMALDSLFGLNSELGALYPLYQEGDLAIVHGVGSEDETRSHFEAQDLMEHAGPSAGGWLGRYLRTAPRVIGGPLASICIGATQPESLRGAPASVVMESIQTLSLGEGAEGFMDGLAGLYRAEEEGIGRAGHSMLTALRKITELQHTPYVPAAGAIYSGDDFGHGMREVAQLLKARVGVEAVALDLHGWDSHIASFALMNPLMRSLGDSLRAFRTDLGPQMAHTTVVVMTEFGRRVYENASFGTDHGRGSAMMVMGGGVCGGRVHHAWKPLEDAYLEGPGDVPVTTNYRDVLASVFSRHGGLSSFESVFPGFAVAPVALYG
ncbi:MAG: DUF1501 domain-containing protein [Candidatus Hydrogenedentes bacterium]|nr:DUF1501 domain-containing protein [Candidatus Hydrogenedentota bacterium]